MPPLTAILISYNEELDLPRALASLAGIADEMILVDSGSTDRTCEIAREHGAASISRKLNGFADKKILPLPFPLTTGSSPSTATRN